MIGSRLTEHLLSHGYEVSHLSRSGKNATVKTFLWDPSAFRIDENALTSDGRRSGKTKFYLAGRNQRAC